VALLLGRATWTLVRDAVEVEPPRVLDIPGRRAGEPAYRLLAVRAGAAGRSRRLDAPFVGRDAELRLVQWAYERAAAEHALALVTVLGGAGVGKTRLVLEAAGRLEGDPAVLVGRCLPYGNGSTFWPLAEVVRQAAGIGLEDPPEEARAKLAALLEGAVPEGALVAERIGQLIGQLIGLEADPAPVEEAAWSTGRLLEALAAERPLVVVFDDLHWAEPTFLDLVERLGEGGRGAPVLLVAVARPELLEQRPAWAGGRPNAVSMLLEPLGPQESGALLDGLARGRDAAGHGPGADHPGRRRQPPVHRGATGSLRGTPPTIQALVAARLDRLEGRDRDVLERAAVVGQAFEQDTVAELSPPDARAQVPERLGRLVRREFLRTAPARLPAGAGYQFRHLLVRDAVYRSVPKQVRADPHERLAGLLEARAGAGCGSTRRSSATSWSRPGAAWPSWARSTGAAASFGRAYLSAVYSQFAAAVELLAGRPDAAEAVLVDADRALERLGETGERSNIAANLAHALLAQDRQAEAARYADTCRSLAAREDLYAQVRWRGASARVLAAQGRDAEAGRLAGEAVALAERTDMLNLRAAALLDLAATARAGGRPDDEVAATRGPWPCTRARATWPRSRPSGPCTAKIVRDAGTGRGSGMPHWDLDGGMLDRLQLDLARAVDPERDFHPQDARRLVAIGRAIGNLARLAWDDPEYQVRLNETRMQFTSQVTGVLLEARGEAGEERLVDPELLAALTEALILAAGDPRPWGDG
jgi:hypothetical protein